MVVLNKEAGVETVLYRPEDNNVHSCNAGEAMYRIIERRTTLSKHHAFNIETGKDYRVGIINEFRSSNLINV